MEHLAYTGPGLDRAALRRRDEDWIGGKLRHRESRIIPVWRELNLITGKTGGKDGDIEAVMATGGDARKIIRIADQIVFLGLGLDRSPAEGIAYFAADLSSREAPALAPIVGRAEFTDLRPIGGVLRGEEAALLAYARGILYWHASHQYCGRCGTKTDTRHGGHMRLCANPDCATEHHPRTDPAVIMLVTRPGPEGEACLLGHHPRFPEGMMSTLAGFVEPGESLEEAVAREVLEETGVTVTDIVYQASQPWPFPASLMAGFRALAKTARIDTEADELEEARWFTRAQIRDFDKKGLRLPRKDSLAHTLIDGWMKEGS